jgi:myo-inositol-1(or 4)-monophosphatase
MAAIEPEDTPRSGYGERVPSEVMSVLTEGAARVERAIQGQRGRGLSGLRPTQYHLDVAADEAAVEFLVGEGFRVLSEESGVSGSGDSTVVIDPIDGSTNCDRGIPFYATSLAVHDGSDVVAGLVVNLATGTRFHGERETGAFRDGKRITVSGAIALRESIVSFSGWPRRHAGWSQIRSLGAASLECCLVADGSLDAFVMAPGAALNPWDYLAGLLLVQESGGSCQDLDGQDLVVAEALLRRPVFAASEHLMSVLTESIRFPE